ncbi:unnamed protein product [Brachionus calyciflorus]|uniref:HIT-type domain-containing protein n=1 Tax=Brachionus calyciflorus TaxID=104777 RepID=A0A813VZ27_9BILA|nr:unnamed protein product [Brachionus calyciflorus]
MTSSTLEEPSLDTNSDVASPIEKNIPCEFCLKTKFKYKCPRCGLKTCSLECCRAHKEQTGCSGQRDKTKFVSKEEFNESTLINDYRFLEEQSRLIDAYQRASELGEEHILSGKTLSSLDNDPSKNLQFYSTYENLRKFVHKQWNICLKLMPPQSTRHSSNKTRFNRVKNMVSWSLELIFHLSSDELDKSQKYFAIDTKKTLFSSKETLKSCMKYFYAKFKNDLFDKSNLKYEKNEIKLKKLNLLNEQFKDMFESDSLNDLNILYEIRDFKEKKRYFLKINLDSSLEDCLKNQTMIEYPSLYLVHSNNLCEYEIIENSVNILKNNEEEDQKEINNDKSKEEENGEEREEDDEEGEIEAFDQSESESDHEENLPKKIKLDSSNNKIPIDQNNDRYDGTKIDEESSELEEGEERD